MDIENLNTYHVIKEERVEDYNEFTVPNEYIKPQLQNPWTIQSIYDLQYFNCPSCMFKDRVKQKLIDHAYNSHPWAVEYLNDIQDGSLSDVYCPWNENENNEDDNFTENFENENDYNDYNDYNSETGEFQGDEPNEEEILSANLTEIVDHIVDQVKIKPKFVKSMKGNDMLCDENYYLYTIKSKCVKNIGEKVAKTYYTCSIPSCPARVHTVFGKAKIVGRLHEHNHDPDKSKINDCDICGESYNHSGNLRAHVNRVHKGLKDHECELCGKEFNRHSVLTEHIKKVHKKVKNVIKCEICGESVSNDKSLQLHIKKVHKGLNRNQCSECGKDFLNGLGLAEHMNTVHRLPVVHIQQETDENFKEDYENEYMEDDNQEIVEESNEEKSFKDFTNKELIVEEKIKPRFVKSQMGRDMLCDENYYLYGIKHKDHGDKSKTFYSCSIPSCPARVHTKYGKTKIIKRIHEHNHAPDKSKINTCDICQQSYSNPGNLRVHVNSVHKGLKDFQCEYCMAEYLSSSQLTKHIKNVHEKIKDVIKCDNCGESMINEKSLQLHIKIVHRGFKRNQCELCMMDFKTGLALIEHTNVVHVQEKISQDTNGQVNYEDENFKADLEVETIKTDVEFLDDSKDTNNDEGSQNNIEGIFDYSGTHPSGTPKYVRSKQGGYMLVDEKNFVYRFKQHSRDKTKSFHSCIEKGCSAIVHTIYGTAEVINEVNEHNHECKRQFYNCELCNVSFHIAGTLQSHVNRVHKNLNDYQCESCLMDFNRYGKLKEHVANVHEKLPGFHCDICGESFKHRRVYISHIKNHNGFNTNQCELCGQDFKRGISLKEHMENVHEKTYQYSPFWKNVPNSYTQPLLPLPKFEMDSEGNPIPIDLKKEQIELQPNQNSRNNIEMFQNSSNINPEETSNIIANSENQEQSIENNTNKKQLVDNNGAKFVKSQMGSYLLRDESQHLYRINQHSFDNSKTFYRCAENGCPARVHTQFGKTEIIARINEHNHEADKNKVHTCHFCGDSYTKADNLLAHINNIHKGLKDYQCGVCGKDFNKPTSLRDHVMHVHEGVIKDKKFHCHLCDGKFTASKHLKEHISTIHEGVRDFICSSCGKAFGRKSNLRIHTIAAHEGGRSYECEQCQKIFHSKGGLRNHITSFHEGKKDHICDTCGKAFSQAMYLKTHIMSVHEKLKPFKCEKCDKAFITKTKLKFHIGFKHEGIKKHVCDKCDKVFETPSNLRHHIEYVHEGIKNFKCDFCGTLFGRACTLKRHHKLKRCKGSKLLDM